MLLKIGDGLSPFFIGLDNSYYHNEKFKNGERPALFFCQSDGQ